MEIPKELREFCMGIFEVEALSKFTDETLVAYCLKSLEFQERSVFGQIIEDLISTNPSREFCDKLWAAMPASDIVYFEGDGFRNFLLLTQKHINSPNTIFGSKN